ncbi:hypothetical protein ASNO1_58360 [Corallococcus caeni]|uniref:Uncharacterized protein n=1 Tax=Corallococcus caeni TaxID=3082388 RepID=A0ABQ6QZV9_9BACT|nr:hypothetical protein ASNO1_58360 [Corallococcus sp. NO1]
MLGAATLFGRGARAEARNDEAHRPSRVGGLRLARQGQAVRQPAAAGLGPPGTGIEHMHMAEVTNILREEVDAKA